MRRHFFNNKIGEKIDLSKPYFAIEALEDGLTVKLSINACEYCIDNGEWKTLSRATNTMIINNGQTLSFRGNLTPTSSMGIGTFTISKKCNVKGNVMSLLYKDEFEEQTDLTGKNYVFYKLFYKCTNIVNASELILPATILTAGCYANMFEKCTSLVTAPDLPATILTGSCYAYMFGYCTSLVNAPALPATTLAKECYRSMFNGCSSLIAAPTLPATTLTLYGYAHMFSGCTSLVTAPALPATTLDYGCYYYMFSGCTSLVTAPELPAIGLTVTCYSSMFEGCRSLTQAPELPATTLTNRCYDCMFFGCSSLNYIKALFTTEPNGDYTYCWVDGVSPTGTFVKNASATWDVIGVDGIPEGWIVETAKDYLTIEALEDDLTVSFSTNTIQYSIDECKTWNELPAGTAAPTINSGDKISFKATGLVPDPEYGIGTFTVNKNFNLKGNVMSMLFGDEGNNSYDLTGYDYAFLGLFYDCITLQSVSKDFLPATTLAINCYRFMFQNCSSLVTAPELPATTLADGCYCEMFFGCESLVNAPALPATTLTEDCYNSMFSDCTSLTTAPELPADTLVDNCYMSMFVNCTSLNYIKALFTTTPGTSYTRDWVEGVSSTGTFVKNPAATWDVTGSNGVPTGWTVQTA